jgi:hypothetical protein
MQKNEVEIIKFIINQSQLPDVIHFHLQFKIDQKIWGKNSSVFDELMDWKEVFAVDDYKQYEKEILEADMCSIDIEDNVGYKELLFIGPPRTEKLTKRWTPGLERITKKKDVFVYQDYIKTNPAIETMIITLEDIQAGNLKEIYELPVRDGVPRKIQVPYTVNDLKSILIYLANHWD